MLPDLYISSVAAKKFVGPERKNDVDAELKQLLPTAPRRLNLFIKTALIGAVDCVKTTELGNTDVFISSSNLSIEVMTDLITSAMIEGEPPKPVNFIHSIGNSASFYISQQLNLAGESLFLVEQSDSLAHLLLLAALKIKMGKASVLLGSLQQGDNCIQTGWLLINKQPTSEKYIKLSFSQTSSTADCSTGDNNTCIKEKVVTDIYHFCTSLAEGNVHCCVHSEDFKRQSGFAISLA